MGHVNARLGLLVGGLIAILTCGCAPAASVPTSTAAPTQQPAPSRVLRMAIRVEPASIARNPPREGQTTLDTTRRLFNAELSTVDDAGAVRPLLAAEIPKLNTDTWTVSPDGQMETTYRLRPGLTWHDGAPLTADDFVFGWRVIADPALGYASLLPQKLMAAVAAPDPSTVVIRWSQPFPDADNLNITFSALPDHILRSPYDQQTGDTFASNPFWSTAFVGLGPYRLVRWEPGAFIEGEAFAGFVLGQPHIERVQITFVTDPNAALTRLLADDVDMLADSAIKSQQLPTLESDWIARGAGDVVVQPNSYRAAQFQFRPDLVSPASLLDVRVRKALAYAIDKEAVNEAVYRGAGILATNIFPPHGRYASLTEPAAVKYPRDLRQAAALMAEAGYTKGADETFVSAGGARFSAELRTNASDQFETEMHVVGDTWRRAGFDFTEAVTPQALVQDSQTRATFSAVYIYGAGAWEQALRGYTAALIPTAENRWSGANRGAWRNAEWEGLATLYDATLDQAERGQVAAKMARLYSDELPAIAMEFDPDVIAYRKGLTGPRGGPREATVWNISDWDLRERS